MTRFLGAMFSRVGQAGAVYPMNMFKLLQDISVDMSNMLLPSLQHHGMLLPTAVMENAATVAHQLALAHVNGAFAGLPGPHWGISAVLPEFHQLAYIGQRECIPVPYTKCHNYRSVIKEAFKQYQHDCEQAVIDGREAPPSPAQPLLFKHYPKNHRVQYRHKALAIRHLVDIVINLIIQHA